MSLTMHQNINPFKPTVYFIEDLEDVSHISEDDKVWDMASKNKKIFNSSNGLVLTFQPGANLKMVLKSIQAGFQIDVDRMMS